MFTHVRPERAPARSPLRPREPAIARTLARFRPAVQPRVRALAARHRWIEDLALSFPALLFALAHPRAHKDGEAAIELTLAGAPLARIAARAGVPLWLRAFPPEAFEMPLPLLPDGTEFRRRVANHFPKAWKPAPRWLENVAIAARWGDEEIALWFAREAPAKPLRKARGRYAPNRDHRRLIILWAWFSLQGSAHTRPETPWRPGIQWTAAESAANNWLATQTLRLYLPDAIQDVWLEPGEMDGYAFIPLRTANDVIAEAEAMKNCVRSYGHSIATDSTRLWSVRRNGERIATLALAPNFMGPLTHIYELSLAENRDAPAELWLAARRWVHVQDERLVDRKFIYRDGEFSAAAWRKLWRPFWLAKGLPPWLPLKPAPDVLLAL